MIKSRRMSWAGHVTCMREMRNAYNILAGIYEGKRPFRRPRRRWKDNIKKWIKRKKRVRVWTGFVWFRLCSVAGSYECLGSTRKRWGIY
jgi:hypothetical protein